MPKLTELTTYVDAQKYFSRDKLWELFDGNIERFNIAHECVDRYAKTGQDALIVVHADGRDEIIRYDALSEDSSRFAHYLKGMGVSSGDRIAIMLDPSRAFYTAVFGVLKAGAIAVPLFTLFGPDGVRLRVNDCLPVILVTTKERAETARGLEGLKIVLFDEALFGELRHLPSVYPQTTSADTLAVYQYTSGTTRELPEAVKHRHRTLVTLMIAALYGTGLRPGDRFICPSSPAWGHGLWHGTFAPLALGLTVGAYSGKFDPKRLLQALQDHRFTNMSAAATHYRMIRTCKHVSEYQYFLNKLSFTGEPIDADTATFVGNTFGHEVCSMYGTTELGVVLVNYPGATDFTVKAGSLGKPTPGGRIQVQNEDGSPCPAGVTGYLTVFRHGRWIPTRDLAREDADGYFYHAGRADDVIISSGWTMSAVEIENAILAHPDVREVAVIGVADELRGQVVKAFVVSERPGGEDFIREVKELVKSKLGRHEYPRQFAFVPTLPRTDSGKLNRKVLREREKAAPTS